MKRTNVGFLCPVPPSKDGLTHNVKRFEIISQNENYNCFVFTNTKHPNPIKGCTVVSLREDFLFSLRVISRLLHFDIEILDIQFIYGLYGKRKKGDVSYIISAYNILSLLILSRIFGIKSIVTMHNIFSDLSKVSVLERWKRRTKLNYFIILFNKLVVSFANSVVALSLDQYKMLTTYSKEWKLHLIHYGMDVNSIDHESDSIFTFSYIGMIRPNKGVDYLLDAFQMLNERHKNVQLIIAGGLGDSKINEYNLYFDKVKKKIEFMKGSYNVIFYEGWVDETQILDILRISDAIVFPYVDQSNEVSGAAFSFAFSGAVYLCSDVPRFNSSFSNNIDAIFFPCCSVDGLYAAMEKAMTDDILRKKISENLKAMAKNFSWANNAQQYIKIYNSLL